MHLINNQHQAFCVMKQLPNFTITAQSDISHFFSSQKVGDFHQAIRFIKQNPTTPDCSVHDLLQVAKEGGSRCAKTALLVRLAQENLHQEIKLVLCTFSERYESNPLVQQVLQKYGLPTLPIASCFLKYHQEFYSPLDNINPNLAHIQSDIEITPTQIGSFTQRYYHHFIKHWLTIENLHRSWTVEKIRQVKQECQQILEERAWPPGKTTFEA
ncbi:MAG: hypothetical protein AAF944_27715 [Bacteroidota bacterium]